MDFSWIWVMVVKPMSDRARVVGSERSRVEKGLRSDEGSLGFEEEEGVEVEGEGEDEEGLSAGTPSEAIFERYIMCVVDSCSSLYSMISITEKKMCNEGWESLRSKSS